MGSSFSSLQATLRVSDDARDTEYYKVQNPNGPCRCISYTLRCKSAANMTLVGPEHICMIQLHGPFGVHAHSFA